MDNRAGLEEIGGGLNVTAKSTYDLVSNKSGSQTLLAGSWENQIVSKEGDNLIFSGYNFGYPVISLQKRYAKDINSLHDADSTKFHEYTGNGGYNTTANGIDVATKYSYIVSLATEKDASGQDRGRYYDNAIKIPHLGVLNLFTNRASHFQYT